MSIARLFGLLVMIFFANPAIAQNIEATEWLDAAQDSTGMIWGVPLSAGTPVFVHDGKGWKALSWSPAPNSSSARPIAIMPGLDGLVRILWKQLSGGNTCWLSEHRWPTSSTVAQFNAKFEDPEFKDASLFVDSQANVWITHKGPTILRKTRGGGVTEAYAVPKEHLLNEKDEKGRNSFFNSPRVFEDGRHHVWFWTSGRSNNVVRFDSFIEYDGSKFNHHTFSPIPPDARCYALIPEDPSHLLAAFRSEGLYRIDVTTFAAERIEAPARNAFREIYQIFRTNNTDFIVASSFYDRSEGNILWRWQPGRPPEKVTAGVGRLPVDSVPWFQLPNGMLVGAAGMGLMFVPVNGEPQSLDWSQNVSVRTPQRLFRTAANNLLIVSGRGGSATASLPPWSQATANPAFEEIKTKDIFARDSRGHVWATELVGHEVQEWDGAKWNTRIIPFADKQVNAIAIDNHDRIWMFDSHHGPYVWDQNSNQWSQWSNMHEAAERFLRDDPHLGMSTYHGVRFASSGDGRAIIRHGIVGSADYFDGRTWRMWRSAELPHGFAQFDTAGQLLVADHANKQQQWRGDSWIPVETTTVQLVRPKVPWDASETEIGRTEEGQEILSDQNGDRWSTENRRVYRAHAQNHPVPIFHDNEANPFMDGRGLMDVIVDGAGNVFLKTNATSSDWVLLRKQFLPSE